MRSQKVYKMYKNKEIDLKNIIDIRDKYELDNGKIKGSKNIPMNKLLAHPEKFLDKKETYYILCQSGVRSLSTTISLKFKGYKVKNISGGYLKWKSLSM